jgi:hypothetical protein
MLQWTPPQTRGQITQKPTLSYTVATSGVMINRLHTLPETEQDKEKFETQSKSNIAQGYGHT